MSISGNFSEESLLKYQQLTAEAKGTDFTEGDTYDFTRCMRPDGTYYGTQGNCKKGQKKGKGSSKDNPALRNLEEAKAKRDRIKHVMLTTKDRRARSAMTLAYLAAVAAVKIAEHKMGSK